MVSIVMPAYNAEKTIIESSDWLIGVSHLIDYINEFGTTIVPTEYLCPADNYPLGTWVYNQRKDYKLNRLYNDRYNKLAELGFVFSVHAGCISPRENAYTWINGINHLIEYTKKYHDANVQRDYKSPDGYRLGSWVKNIRNHSYNSLSISQIKQLEALGFCFTGCRRGDRPV